MNQFKSFIHTATQARWVAAIPAAVAAIAAVVYTIGALLTLDAIKEGNIASQRSNIVLNTIELYDSSPQGIGVIPKWENTGNTSARYSPALIGYFLEIRRPKIFSFTMGMLWRCLT